LLGLALPAGENIGETWELWDRPDGASRVRGGGGRTVRDLVREDAVSWLGKRLSHLERFPLWIKLIDAREALSVQLHPGDDRPAEGGDRGKQEAWIVLDVGPEGRIVRGLRQGVDRERLARAASTAAIEELLHAFRPSVGDAILIPAGTVHAIGPQVVVLEVQQNSDRTYRLYDWDRGRELHVEQALAALRVPAGGPAPATVTPAKGADGGEHLFDEAAFTVRRYRLDGPVALDTDGTFKVATVTAGRGTLGWRSGGQHLPLELKPGDTALVPASVGRVFVSSVGRLELVWIGPGSGVG
jgi:mannose-6-phosphate isomerase